MAKTIAFIKKATLFTLSLSLTLSCQPGQLPVSNAQPGGPHTPLSGKVQGPGLDFRILDWPVSTGGEGTSGLSSFAASMSFNGAERAPGSDTISLNSNPYQPGGFPPRYGLLLSGYKLDQAGKEYPTLATLVVSASKMASQPDQQISSSSGLNFLAHLESQDGITFTITDASGFGNYSYGAPDPYFHGNLGYGCFYGERGEYAFEGMTGTVTLHPSTKTFNAFVSPKDATGIAEHGLSPWQCAYGCPNGGAYNDTCHNPLNVNGTVSLDGDVTYVKPGPLEPASIPEIFSPANQDQRFDFTYIFPGSVALEQLFRYTLPAFNGQPVIQDSTFGTTWDGKQDASSFYPDGSYQVEVLTDHQQRAQATVQIDNTPPVFGPVTIVQRNGTKAVEIIVEDPEVNGVHAGLHPDQVEARVYSNRPGKWNVGLANLDAHRILVSAVFTPDPSSPLPSDIQENLSIQAWDKVFNFHPQESLPFNFNQTPSPAPTLPPSSDCENQPLLMPEALRPLLDDINNMQSVDPQTLNKYRQYTQQMGDTAAQLQALGVNVPGPQPVVSPVGMFGIQSLTAPGFRVASAAPSSMPSGYPSYDPSSNPSSNPSGNPGNYPPKVQRLLDKYQQQSYQQRTYRESVLASLQTVDDRLHQLLLNSTAGYGAEYQEVADPDPQAGFEVFKQIIEDLEAEFEGNLADLNTYSLLEASRTYANLSLYYHFLLRAQLLGQLPIDNPPSDPTQTEYFSERLEEIIQPWQLVNFTARRLESHKQQLMRRWEKLNQEMTEVEQASRTLKAENQELDRDIRSLAEKARALGIQVTLEEPHPTDPPYHPTEPLLTGSEGGFSTQMAQLLAAPLVPALVTFAEQQALRIGALLVANSLLATQLVQNSEHLLNAAQSAAQLTRQDIAKTQKLIAKPNQTPAQIQANQAHMAQAQNLLNEINRVMEMAKDKSNQAKENSKNSENNRKNTKNKCQGLDCEKEVSQNEIDKKLGGLKNIENMTARDAIRSRGGNATNVRKIGHWADETVGEIAKWAIKGDRTAETAIKIIKQAAEKGQNH